MFDVGGYDGHAHVVPIESPRQLDVIGAVVGHDTIPVAIPQRFEFAATGAGQGWTAEDLLDEVRAHLIVTGGNTVGFAVLQGGDDTVSWFHTGQ